METTSTAPTVAVAVSREKIVRLQRKINRHAKALMDAQLEAVKHSIDVNAAPLRMLEAPQQARMLCAEYVSAMPHPEKRKCQRECIKVFLRWAGDRPMTRELLEQWFVWLGSSKYSQSYRKELGLAPMAVARWASATRRIPVDITHGLRAPKGVHQQPRPVWTEEETELLIDIARRREKTMHMAFLIRLGWETGMAISDCCNLEWWQVDMDKCTIRRKRIKTGVEAIIPFTFGGKLHEALKQQLEDTKRAFGGTFMPTYPVCRQAYMHSTYMASMLNRLVKKSGLPHRSFHSWRGTFISDCINKGVAVPVAMRMAGLKTVATLNAYATIDEKLIREQRAQIR